MKSGSSNRLLKVSLRLLCAAAVLAGSSTWAAFVTWDLNPDNLNASVGSSSHDFTVSGYTITAHGYDNQNGVGNERMLYYKHDVGEPEEFEHGLGLVGILHNELQVGPNGVPLHFIQFDLSSILAAGLLNGQISVGSVQAGELWSMYGSNALGMLGTQLNSTPFGTETNGQFVSIPNFGTYHYISVVAAALDVLPVALRAELVPIPETASLIPIALLIVCVTFFEIRRRRRA